MAPVLLGVALHHGDGIVHLVVGTHEVGNGVGIAVAVGVQVVGGIVVQLFLSLITFQRDGHRGSQVERRPQGRTPRGVGIDTRVVGAHIRKVCTQFELIQEVAFF